MPIHSYSNIRAGVTVTRCIAGTTLLLSFALLGGCKSKEPATSPPPTVTTTRPISRDVTEYLEASGQLSARNTVNLVARVQGYVEAIGYQDGEFVKKGKTLFAIESTTYAAQRDQAKANLASAIAKAEFSEQQYRRYAELDKTDSTSRQQVEQMRSNRDADQASVLQGKANLEQAQTTLGYANVTAPFDGFVTAHQANVGQLVGENQPTQLATILQLDPIWVNFNISEQDVQRFRNALLAADPKTGSLQGAPLEIGLQGEVGYPHLGKIDYAAPQIDAGTGTLTARGTFDNPAHVLLPGNFVHIRIPLGSAKKALLLPGSAIRSDQGDQSVLVVTSANIVESRAVTLGPQEGSLQVIASGIQATDRVIVNGIQAARVGATVHALEGDLSSMTSVDRNGGQRP